MLQISVQSLNVDFYTEISILFVLLLKPIAWGAETRRHVSEFEVIVVVNENKITWGGGTISTHTRPGVVIFGIFKVFCDLQSPTVYWVRKKIVCGLKCMDVEFANNTLSHTAVNFVCRHCPLVGTESYHVLFFGNTWQLRLIKQNVKCVTWHRIVIIQWNWKHVNICGKMLIT